MTTCLIPTPAIAGCASCESLLHGAVLCAVPVPPGEKCIIPECKRQRYTDGSVTHSYCSKSHAEEGRKRGIFRELLQFGMKLNRNHSSVLISLSISIPLCLSVCL